jgi:hypothetical protein
MQARRRQRSDNKTIHIYTLPSSISRVVITLYSNTLLGVLGAEGADSLSGTPDLQVVDLGKLFVVLLAVVRLRVVLERALGLASVPDGSV